MTSQTLEKQYDRPKLAALSLTGNDDEKWWCDGCSTWLDGDPDNHNCSSFGNPSVASLSRRSATLSRILARLEGKSDNSSDNSDDCGPTFVTCSSCGTSGPWSSMQYHDCGQADKDKN